MSSILESVVQELQTVVGQQATQIAVLRAKLNETIQGYNSEIESLKSQLDNYASMEDDLK